MLAQSSRHACVYYRRAVRVRRRQVRGTLVYVHCPHVTDVYDDADDPDGLATYIIPQGDTGIVACGGEAVPALCGEVDETGAREVPSVRKPKARPLRQLAPRISGAKVDPRDHPDRQLMCPIDRISS